MKKNNKKKVIIAVTAVVLVAAISLGCFFLFGRGGGESVGCYEFNSWGMSGYWGDNKETSGPVTTDRIQTVYLSSTQTVTEVLVQPGDTVKKGDVLMRFDTTLSDLALERKRLDVEKLKVDLDKAYAYLREINAMVPMVIPTPTEPSPTDPNADLGLPLAGTYQVTGPQKNDGSSLELPLICWLANEGSIDNTLLAALREKASELQTKNLAEAQPTQPPTSGETVPPTSGETVPPTTEETVPSTGGETEPPATEETAPPTTGETEPPTSEEPAPPTGGETEPPTQPEPTQPPKVEVNDFYVIFKVTEGDMSKGTITTWQGLRVIHNSGNYFFRFFDASGIKDPSENTSGELPEDPGIDIGSGYTAAQIAQMRNDQEKTIRDLEFQIKMAEADYKIMQKEVESGDVIAEFDGEVVSLISEDEAKINSQPFLKVSGGGGFYIRGSVSELDMEDLVIGQEVTINDWNTGSMVTGTIQSIGDYPTENYGWSSSQNPNVSYYPFTVFVDGSADLQEGYYVSIQYGTQGGESGNIYIEAPFLRQEGGRYFAYVMGENGTLEKRWVETGKTIWGGQAYEVLSGLTEEDMVCFPYGKNVREGAPAVEGDIRDLYNY